MEITSLLPNFKIIDKSLPFEIYDREGRNNIIEYDREDDPNPLVCHNLKKTEATLQHRLLIQRITKQTNLGLQYFLILSNRKG